MILFALLIGSGVYLGYLVYDLLLANNIDFLTISQLVETNPDYQLIAALLAVFLVLAIIVAWRYSSKTDDLKITRMEKRSLEYQLAATEVPNDDEDSDQSEVVEKLDEMIDLLKERQGQVNRFDPNEDPEDALEALDNSVRFMEGQLSKARRHFDGEDYEDRVREAQERLAHLRTSLAALENRSTAVQKTRSDVETMGRQIQSAIARIVDGALGEPSVEEMIESVTAFLADAPAKLARAQNSIEVLEPLTERLRSVDADSRALVTGGNSVVERTREAERLVAQIRARIAPLVGVAGNSNNGTAAVPDISARLSKIGTDVGEFEKQLDKLDIGTGLERVNALRARIDAASVMLTGRDPAPANAPALAVVSRQ